MTKGIITAGGQGTRLRPFTKIINKHLLPVHDKPMIFYPISMMILAGIREIIIVVNPNDKIFFEQLLSEYQLYDLNLSYVVQNESRGICDALKLCTPYLNGQDALVILGDNFIYGDSIGKQLSDMSKDRINYVVSKYHPEPQHFGVIDRNVDGSIKRFVEKPTSYISNEIVTGLYKLNYAAFEKIELLAPSQRGEFEITDLLNLLVHESKVNEMKLGRGHIWFDLGTLEKLEAASNFVSAVQLTQGYEIANLYEILADK